MFHIPLQLQMMIGGLTLRCVQQASSSSGSLSSDGFKSNSEYSKSQLEASAAQKDGYFARKMQVRQLPITIPRKGSVWVQQYLLLKLKTEQALHESCCSCCNAAFPRAGFYEQTTICTVLPQLIVHISFSRVDSFCERLLTTLMLTIGARQR